MDCKKKFNYRDTIPEEIRKIIKIETKIYINYL